MTECSPLPGPPPLNFNYRLPYGAILRPGGVQFSVVSRQATGMRLLLYKAPDDAEPSSVVDFDPKIHRRGDVWSIFLEEGVGPGTLYHLQANGPFDPACGDRFDPKARLIDPYAKALWGDFLPGTDGIVRPPKCVVVSDEFDWSGDRHLRYAPADSIIYELHVGGFTRSKTSGVSAPGTYRGVIEKIPYLQSLGVTAVELMPVHEFPTNESDGTSATHPNYWGYDPMAFFAPHRGYAQSGPPGDQVRQFKEMVLALHQAGIEVILDVVFNHTAEGNENGPTLSFKGLANRNYYLLDPDGAYCNYSGCGNTVNGNHPLMREMIFSCLRYWVHNFHIDGFRFDLASILSRDRQGKLVANPPVLENIAEDPMLAETKIIAEAWDAAGAYQVGSFGSHRWAEWNGRYRDDMRRFWRGEGGMVGPFATRLSGSNDLYGPSGRACDSSINFITAHDGFTLSDLVSYREKHNQANGEGNRDGENCNFSDNGGIEGPTLNPSVEEFRARQIRNFFATLFFSQGVPMILAGDEIRRTQRGNNNAWCQNNEISWFDWQLVEKEKDLLRFVQTLIALRRSQPTLRRRNFFTGQPTTPGELPDISWFSPEGGTPDWNTDSAAAITALLAANSAVDRDEASQTTERIVPPKSCAERYHFLLMVNGSNQPRRFAFPAVTNHPDLAWRLFLDTSGRPPADIYPKFNGPAPNLTNPQHLAPHAVRIFTARY